MQVVSIDAGVFNLPGWSGKKISGFAGTENHPFLPTVIPEYRFNLDHARVFNFVWAREQARPVHESRVGLLLMGPKGCGKTTSLDQFYARLGVPVVSDTANKHTHMLDLIGSKGIVGGDTVWEDGKLTLAMRMGVPFVLNEINLVDPAVATGLNEIIERGIVVLPTGEVVKAARGFTFNGTMNTRGAGDAEGAYAGVRVMNKALLRRFLKLWMEYPNADEEAKILLAKFPNIGSEPAANFVKTANLIRDAYAGKGTNASPIADTISTAELLMWVELCGAFEKIAQSPVHTTLDFVLGNCTDDVTRQVMHDLIQQVFNV